MKEIEPRVGARILSTKPYLDLPMACPATSSITMSYNESNIFSRKRTHF